MSDKLYQALNITQNDFDFIYNKVIDENYLGFKNLSIQQFKKILETIVELDKLEQKKTAMTDRKMEVFFKIKKQLEDLKYDCVKSDNGKHYDMAYQILEDFNDLQHFLDLENTSSNKKDPIVEQVIDKFKSRSQEGIKKYGTTLADNKLTQEEWLTHLQEELMDAVIYLEKIKSNL